MSNNNYQEKKQEATIWQHIDRKDFKQAAMLCVQLNRQYPEFGSGWHTMSYIALKLGNAAIALDAIDKALALQPAHLDWQLQKANTLMALRQVKQAEAIALTLADKNLTTPYQCSTLARILSGLELQEKAAVLYEKAIALDPKNAGEYYNLAAVQRYMGDVSAAENNLNKCISLNPQDADAIYLRSSLRTQTADNNHIKALRALSAQTQKPAKSVVKINYALAKELEDIGDYSLSFEYLKLAADTRRQHLNYQLDADLKTIDAIIENYSADQFEQKRQGHDAQGPIFIVGMPRTGTTLVERIVASHSEVDSAGELPNFSQQLVQLVQLARESAGGSINREQLVALTTELDFAQLGERYIKSVEAVSGKTGFVIDKLPLNFLYVGLIHLALPNAKIIHLQRNPMDTCYAVYKTLFEDVYPFSYNLTELARYYVAYQKLMAHWQQQLPGVIHTVSYEALVNNAEQEAKQLIAYCGLEWQEQCLRFYENKQASTTASATQVRQPIYQSSINKWQAYQQALQPVKAILEAAGIDCG